MLDHPRILLCRDDGRSHAPGEDGCEAETSLTPPSDSKASGLFVKARLMPEKPLFKMQHGFNRHGAVKLFLPAFSAQYLAVYQHKDWWIRPAFVDKVNQIPSRTQLLVWQDDSGYHVLMALCGKDYRADLQGENGELAVTLSSNQDGLMACETPALAYARGTDPFTACEEAARLAVQMTGTGKLRLQKRFPPVFDKLGWCTWDAFYHQVNASGVYQKLDEFREKHLPVGWVLIDDGWSQADYDKQELQGLDAVPEKFPGGLKGTISHIKKSYGISYVGVWQALMGYWNGVDHGSPAYEAFRDSLSALPDGRLVPDPQKCFAFWNTWHSYLARLGVDFVKVDQQSAPALFFGGLRTYGESSRGMQAGLGASAALHFDGNAIHCMGMSPEEMWSRPSAALIRSSDDFVPDAPGGFLEHLKQNAYGALLFGPMYWGDFDMFWSAHEKGVQHAMLRAVSGGPVYISDKVGQTDAGVLWPLISSDGTVYRCEAVGLPTLDCLLVDPEQSGKPLKIWNVYKGSFLVAAFSPREDGCMSGVIRLEDIPKAGANAYVLVPYGNGRAGVLRKGEEYPFMLSGGQSALFLLIPKHEKCTVIGLMDKYLSCAAAEQILYSKNACHIILKESGTLGFYMEEMPKSVLSESGELPLIRMSEGLWTVNVPEKMAIIQW